TPPPAPYRIAKSPHERSCANPVTRERRRPAEFSRRRQKQETRTKNPAPRPDIAAKLDIGRSAMDVCTGDRDRFRRGKRPAAACVSLLPQDEPARAALRKCHPLWRAPSARDGNTLAFASHNKAHCSGRHGAKSRYRLSDQKMRLAAGLGSSSALSRFQLRRGKYSSTRLHRDPRLGIPAQPQTAAHYR